MVFPTTRHSAVLAVGSDDPVERARSFALIASAYWRPVYKLIRLKWGKSPEEAEDLCQTFFATALEKGWFAGYDASKARFRTYVRTLLDRFNAKEHRDANRMKRGGGAVAVSFDFAEVERELGTRPSEDPEELFDREWVRSLFTMALEGLRAESEDAGRPIRFRVFERYELSDEGERPTYAALAQELGVSVHDVTNQLHYARRDLRRLVLERLRELTASEEEFREEAQRVLGTEA